VPTAHSAKLGGIPVNARLVIGYLVSIGFSPVDMAQISRSANPHHVFVEYNTPLFSSQRIREKKIIRSRKAPADPRDLGLCNGRKYANMSKR
jgi:hypothetical protein